MRKTFCLKECNLKGDIQLVIICVHMVSDSMFPYEVAERCYIHCEKCRPEDTSLGNAR